jgi:hypothetical protein
MGYPTDGIPRLRGRDGETSEHALANRRNAGRLGANRLRRNDRTASPGYNRSGSTAARHEEKGNPDN